MADEIQTTKAMTRTEREALADIAHWFRPGRATSPYTWKQASMRKLKERGLVIETGHKYGDAIGYVITPEGQTASKEISNG